MAVVSTIALVDSRRTHIRSWCSALEGVKGGLADAAQGGPALGDGLAGGCVCLTNQDASPFLQGILVRALCTELQGHRLHMHPHNGSVEASFAWQLDVGLPPMGESEAWHAQRDRTCRPLNEQRVCDRTLHSRTHEGHA